MSSNSAFINTMRFNFLYVDRYSFGKSWVHERRSARYNMLRYILEGELEFTIDDKTYTAGKDEVIYIPQGYDMSCHTKGDMVSFISIRFFTSVRYEGADFLSDYFAFPTVSKASPQIKDCFNEVYRWAKSDTRIKIFKIRGNLELIIGGILENQEEIRPVSRTSLEDERFDLIQLKKRAQKSCVTVDPRIQAVIDYILLHPTEQYPAQKLCRMAELGQTEFRKLFKKQTGKTPGAFIRDLRLTTAARLLLISSDPVSSISLEVGYEDPNHFIRLFKKAFGFTPNQYRSHALE